MLTNQDIEFMKESRKEMVGNRQTQIIIEYPGEVEYDELSGEVIGGEPLTREVMSVVTEIASASNRFFDRVLSNGIVVEQGDLWLSIAYELIEDIYVKLDRMYYDGEWYVIMSSDKKGIGTINRVEVLARVET